MDYIFKLTFVIIIFIYSWFFTTENQEWDIIRTMLKDANNMAVHDAAQEVNEYQLSQGRLIINPGEAYETFRETLGMNLGLDSELNPKVGSRFHDKVKIVDFVIFDESSGKSFPFLYEDSRYGITKYIQGPCVVAVVETEHPVILAGSKKHKAIQVPAVQEYKFNR
ncbi:hypothetical protein NST41_32975 [Paenibacillus sp. FSL L8-0696]|uniref:hypothetical protein n=1 Tax=Paenibacillus sp. FSL L8-0696 TaxID=2954524 RepID=UPI003119B67A